MDSYKEQLDPEDVAHIPGRIKDEWIGFTYKQDEGFEELKWKEGSRRHTFAKVSGVEKSENQLE